MNHRRIAGIVVIVALVALAVPTAGEAAVRGDLGDVSGGSGLLERIAAVWEWAAGVVADLGGHLAKEGAGITGSG